MATSKLGLPTLTGNMSADVVRDMNALAEAVDGKVGVAGGLATLGADGKVPAAQSGIPEHAAEKATATKLGHVKPDGTTITVDANGVISTKQMTASNVTLVDADNHFTSTELEGALKELFTFANDGKTNIASVIGSPATSGDTFSQLVTYIQNSKNTLASNLTAKKQPSTGSESLVSLATKVNQIEVTDFAVGDYVIYSDTTTTEHVNTNPDQQDIYVLAKEVRVNFSGGVRVSFELSSSSYLNTAYGRVHINNSPVGIERMTSDGSYQKFVEDFAVKKGDIIRIYHKKLHYNYRVATRNFSVGINMNNLISVL